MDRKLAIVGGGIHGVVIARAVTSRGLIPLDEVAIVDPSKRLLDLWVQRLLRCNTKWLRSPETHHVDGCVSPTGLADWGASHFHGEVFYRGAGTHPMVPAFNAHADAVLEAAGLNACHIRDRVIGLEKGQGAWRLVLERGGAVTSPTVVIAVGPRGPRYPDWAVPFRGDPLLQHIFDAQWRLERLASVRHVSVVGGGTTALQLFNQLFSLGYRVTLVTRSPVGKKAPSWPEHWEVGSKLLAHLHSLPYPDRRVWLAENSAEGSVPSWDLEEFRANLADPRGDHVQAKIRGLRKESPGYIFELEGRDGHPTEAVVLSTGFESGMPEWLVQVARKHHLPVIEEHGVIEPVLDHTLQWGEGTGLYWSGPGAEPVLGPYAPNIVGGMRAGDILCELLA